MAVVKTLARDNQAYRDVVLGYCLFGLGYSIEDFWSYRLEGETDHRDIARCTSILDGLVQVTAAVPPTLVTPVSTNKASGAHQIKAPFASLRSPVHTMLARIPEELCVLSIGFRPARTETWEVTNVRHVNEDGSDRPGTDNHVFTMQVDTQGTVRYVDNAIACAAV